MVDVECMKRNYSKEDFVWILENVFSNRVVDDWISLSPQCVKSCTINTYKKHCSVHLEPESSNHR